ncbi:Regulator of chromosome condensation (RCC1) repeat [Nesidiocoris tenuis]|uniref:Regulator of chromosome condensation (RCC1) repeat n=1 Tax=Nesidiocoris tenuis TaxID=355587 RepID=A0ABN7A956_9HEMI|nr:Regulator of chromosome condensation (RCC1) repeat [Nesidiocoris tenuis]
MGILKEIVSFAGGATHSFLLTSKGRVYGAGSNSKGQLLTLLTENIEFREIVSTQLVRRITQLATKWETSYALDDNGSCWSWGPNNYGHQGRPSSDASKRYEVRILSSRVKQVAAGLRHVTVLHEDGTVSTAGDNRKCQLGYQSALQHLERVPSLDGVVQIACGQNHSLALTNDGKIFGWGCNKFRQLADNEALTLNRPTLIYESRSTDIKLLCGWTHSAILDQCGKLTNWGRNSYCQLGIQASPWEPPRTLDFKPFKDVAFGSEHCLGITVDNELVSWGWNEHGSCGNGDYDVGDKPTYLKINNVSQIGAGTGQSFAVVA